MKDASKHGGKPRQEQILLRPILSVILPVYNERETLGALRQRLIPVLDAMTSGNFEVIFVNDGSRDGSHHLLNDFHNGDNRLKIIHFSRNFGHQAALQAGLDFAGGDAVVLMDADLQDPPEVLPQFFEWWREGYEVVYAVRRKRKEGLVKRAAYSVFYRTMRILAQIDVPLDAGDFCLLDRRVVEALVALRERNRFLRGLRSWVGFRQIGVEYDRDARYAGEPKYTLRKLIALAVSGYIGFSTVPLQISTWLGLFASIIGFVVGVGALATKIAGVYSPQGWVSTVSVVLFLGGVQLLMLGVIGNYLGRIYDEVRNRPLYIVGSRHGVFAAVGSEDAAVADVARTSQEAS